MGFISLSWGITNHLVLHCLVFWGNSILLFSMASLIYFANSKTFLFSTSSPTLGTMLLFENSQSYWNQLVFHWGPNFAFPGWLVKLRSSFLCLFCTSPFLKSGIFLLLNWLSSFYILDTKPLSDVWLVLFSPIL